MKDLKVCILEAGGKKEYHELRIKPGTLARDVLSELKLAGFQLMKSDGGAFRFDEDIYAAVTNQQILFTVKSGLEAQGMPLIETDLSLADQPKDSRKPRSSLSQEELYKEGVKDRIRKYSRRASIYRVTHNILQFIIFTGAATVTIIITISEVPKWLPALISGLVTVATAATNFYKFGERGIDFYLTSEEMQQEYNWFVTGRSQYKNLNSDETFGLFMDRIENLMRSHTQRSFALEKPGEDQSKGPKGKGNRNNR